METTTVLFEGNKTNFIIVKSDATKTQLALYDYLIPSLGSLIILVNLLVVISSGLIVKKGQQPQSTYLFLGNVAMADLVTGVAVVFGQVFPKSDRNHQICSLQIGMIVASTLTSVYSVGLIAIDRFLYIIHGLQYQQWVYPMRTRLLILTTWIIGAIVGFLPLMGWYGDTDNGRICWFTFLAPKPLILLTVILGVLPLAVVAVLYSIILYHALKTIGKMRRSLEARPSQNRLRFFRGRKTTPDQPPELPSQRSRSNLLLKIFRRPPSAEVRTPSRWRAVKVVFFTTASFYVTWAPYFVASLVYVYQCEVATSKRCKSLQVVIASPLAILGFTNSLINPIIYAWWHKGFRNFVKKRMSVITLRPRRRRKERSGKRQSTCSKISPVASGRENQNSAPSIHM